MKKQVYNWKEKSRLSNIILSIDQLGNTIFNILPWPFTWPGVGNPDKTISYTLGQLEHLHGGKIPWRWPLARILAAICDLVDKDHCAEAYRNGT